MAVFRDAKLPPPPSSPPLQQGFSFSFFIPGPVVKRLPRHDVWLSSSREVRGFIGRVKTKPLICIGISKAEEKPVSPDSMGRLRQCVCRVRVVSDSCSLVRISNMWCCMSKTSWPTAPNWSNKYSFYTFSQKKAHSNNSANVLSLRKKPNSSVPF